MSDFSLLRQISFFVVINNVAKGEMFLYLKKSSFNEGNNYFFFIVISAIMEPKIIKDYCLQTV